MNADRVVFAAYGWPKEIGDQGILKNLLAFDPEGSSRKVAPSRRE